MDRRVVIVGVVLSLSLACDGLELGPKADKADKAEEVATPSTEPATQVDEAKPPESNDAVAPSQPSPSEPAAIEPSPSELPAEPAAIDPAARKPPPPMVGNAQQVLATLLAGIEVPDGAVIKDIKKRAWEDYLDYGYHEAGEAFALLTKLDPKSWVFPFTAARAAAGRGEMERAQVFLVEALLRGGTEARDKANKEPTLRETRKLPWFADLIAADPIALAAWEIREPPPLVIRPYDAGTAPVAIRNVEITSVPPSSKAHEQTKLQVVFDIETLGAPGAHTDAVIATCKVGDRYLHDEVHIGYSDGDLATGQRKRVDVTMHDQEWNEPRSFDMCEVEVIGRAGAPAPDYRLIAQYCWTSAGVREGACSDFARPATDDIQITRVSVQPKLYGPEPGVFVEWIFGRRPDRDTHLAVHFVCEAEGRQIDSVAVVHRSADFGRPGSAMQASTMLHLDGREATRCDLEVYRSRGGPRDIPAASRYCYEQGKTRPGRCGS